MQAETGIGAGRGVPVPWRTLPLWKNAESEVLSIHSRLGSCCYSCRKART